jgi:hypothetical protein
VSQRKVSTVCSPFLLPSFSRNLALFLPSSPVGHRSDVSYFRQLKSRDRSTITELRAVGSYFREPLLNSLQVSNYTSTTLTSAPVLWSGRLQSQITRDRKAERQTYCPRKSAFNIFQIVGERLV